MKNILILCFVYLLAACGQPGTPPKTANTTQTKKISPQEVLVMDPISSIPSDMEGAGCAYANDQAEFYNGMYLFADDFDIGYALINGVLTKFKSDETEIKGADTMDVWINDRYKLIININKTGTIDFSNTYQGTLILKAKNGQQLKKQVYGECGC